MVRMPRSAYEVDMMLFVTGVTNLCMVPAIVLMIRRKLAFEAFIGTFTMITSAMYHCCDSVEHPLWLSEGEWHKLDNIGSIMCFICLSIHLQNLSDPWFRQIQQYFFFGWVLIVQEKDPWNEVLSAYPIMTAFGVLFGRFAYYGKLPPYDYSQMRIGLGLLGVAILCFVRGLDDDNDPFRFFHGCWHAFVGAAAYFNFRVLPAPVQKHRLV